MTNVKETCDLARTLLTSTATYVANHIHSRASRLAYARSISRCEQIFSEAESGNDLTVITHKLFALRHSMGGQLKKKWFNRESEYYTIGVQHAIDVAESISIRFVNGYSGKDTLLDASILGEVGDEHQICACLSSFGQTKR